MNGSKSLSIKRTSSGGTGGSNAFSFFTMTFISAKKNWLKATSSSPALSATKDRNDVVPWTTHRGWCSVRHGWCQSNCEYRLSRDEEPHTASSRISSSLLSSSSSWSVVVRMVCTSSEGVGAPAPAKGARATGKSGVDGVNLAYPALELDIRMRRRSHCRFSSRDRMTDKGKVVRYISGGHQPTLCKSCACCSWSIRSAAERRKLERL
jgi:hypothetical protein